MPMNEQNTDGSPTRSEIIYKLGQIEAKIEANKSGWFEPVKRIEDLLKRLEHQFNEDLVEVKVDVSQAKKDISDIQTTIATWKAKIVAAGAVLTAMWAVFGDTVHNVIDGVL